MKNNLQSEISKILDWQNNPPSYRGKLVDLQMAAILALIKKHEREQEKKMAEKWDEATERFYCESCGKFMTLTQQEALAKLKDPK